MRRKLAGAIRVDGGWDWGRWRIERDETGWTAVDASTDATRPWPEHFITTEDGREFVAIMAHCGPDNEGGAQS